MRKTLINSLAVGVILFGSLWVIIERYHEEKTVETSTTAAFPPIAIAFFTIITIGAISYIAANFKGLIYKEPFGSFSVLLYGVTAATLAGLGYLWVETIRDAAETNTERFVEAATYHATTFEHILAFALIGLSIAAIEPVLRLVNKISTR